MKYVTVFEKTNTGYPVYVPDLAGCTATGRTLREAKRRMQDAIAFHLEGMLLLEGLALLKPLTTVATLTQIGLKSR